MKDVANLFGVATSISFSLADFALHAEGNETAETRKKSVLTILARLTHDLLLFHLVLWKTAINRHCNQRKL